MKRVPFVMLGYPTLEDSLSVLAFLKTRGAMVETTLPKNPSHAKGIVRQVHRAARENGVMTSDVFEAFQNIHPNFLMLSKKPDACTLQQIRETFDVTLFPASPSTLHRLNAVKGTRFAAKVQPGQKNLEARVSASQAFVYLQCAPGRGQTMYRSDAIKKTVDRIRATKKIPVVAGFGVTTQADIRKLAQLGVDAVVLGTRSVHAQADGFDAFKKWFLKLEGKRPPHKN
ncbi:tryptophan synthase subunit alpha [Candidatus Micrarchaeota archaeon]|nr:tryptophan synthase subunit alpha [Candidatus Micrarchaeota archaeon]